MEGVKTHKENRFSGPQGRNATAAKYANDLDADRDLKNAIQLLVDMQVRHQSRTLRSMIGFTRRIERDRPHDGAQEERDNINLDTHLIGDTERARQICVKK
ncbi:hypothetical protein [Rhizobium leguminosarum]|uniref:hypothetical protein n=1 Tax=Rhizobium leguminosarum TaxID=384 RepID=UPI001AE7162E|nr:hypothetical protein [Rhizobium leguminosarum]MBP2444475.1 hypothetical protein [Rhizobium leguminosarum]